MSEFTLRPLGFGEILDGAFTLYRRHFLTLFLTALIPIIPLNLLTAMLEMGGAAENPDAMSSELFLLAIPTFFLAAVGFVVLWAALTRQTAQAYHDREVSLGDGYRRGFQSFFRLLGAGILAIVVLTGLLMVLAAVFGVAAAMVLPSGDSPMSTLGAVLVVVIVGAAALGISAAMFAVVPAVVLERKGPLGALRRSWQLSKGARTRIAGVLGVSWIIVALPTIGLGMMIGLGAAMWDPAEAAMLSPAQTVMQLLAGILGGALTTPFMVGCMTLLYYDRRIRTEAYDLEIAVDSRVVAA